MPLILFNDVTWRRPAHRPGLLRQPPGYLILIGVKRQRQDHALRFVALDERPQECFQIKVHGNYPAKSFRRETSRDDLPLDLSGCKEREESSAPYPLGGRVQRARLYRLRSEHARTHCSPTPKCTGSVLEGRRVLDADDRVGRPSGQGATPGPRTRSCTSGSRSRSSRTSTSSSP